jgi:hypothetical protein
MIITNIRFSYLNAFKPAPNPSGDLKFSASILIPKSNTKLIASIKADINKAVEKGINDNKFTAAQVKAGIRIPLRDGDEEHDAGNRGPEYKDCFFINSSSNNAPGVVDNHLQPIIDSDEFYSGCYGHADVNFFPYNTAGNRGVGVGLNNLLKIKDGERLDGRQAAEDAFEKYAEEPESESLVGDDDIPF